MSAEYHAGIAAYWSVQLPRHRKITVFAGCFDCKVRVDHPPMFFRLSMIMRR
jgi:hypothetical protein